MFAGHVRLAGSAVREIAMNEYDERKSIGRMTVLALPGTAFLNR